VVEVAVEAGEVDRRFASSSFVVEGTLYFPGGSQLLRAQCFCEFKERKAQTISGISNSYFFL